ncbi:MAG: stalk domain-containing protein [Caldisericia bacterium]
MKFRSKISLLLSVVLVVSLVNIGVSDARSDFSYAGLVNQVSFDSISNYVKTISSDEFRGRMEGDPGITLARDYISDEFKKMGLTPAGDDGTYLQHYNVPLWYPEAPLRFDIRDADGQIPFEMKYREDYNICVVSGSGKTMNTPLIFAGFGITVSTDGLKYDDYKDVDVDGKIAVIFRHAPMFIQSMFEQNESLYSVMYYNTKIANAISHGAVGVIILENPKLPEKNQNNINIKQGTGYNERVPCLFMSYDGSKKLLENYGYTPEELFDSIDETKAPNSFSLKDLKASIEVNIRVEESVDTSNVVGYIPASDPFGANQTVMITAHYDHVGIDPMGEIYNGAADNGSGTAAMLEVARVLTSSDIRSNINIAFVAFTGEELGLLGSTYMANNPPFPLEGMTVLNMDMVAGSRNAVAFGYDASHTHLSNIFKNFCSILGVDYVYFKANNNSDHGPFAQKGVPAVFVLGQGEQKYHVPDDTFENVSIEGIELVARVITHIVSKMSDPFYLFVDRQDEEKILATNPEYELTGYTGKGSMVYVGGRATTASESGLFKLNLSLSDGDNEITVTSNQVGTGYKIEKKLIINYAPRPLLSVSKDMLNFGYISDEVGKKSLSFEVENIGEGPIEGTIKSCSDWMTITPDTLDPQLTKVSATVDISKVTDRGLNTCMLTIDTTGVILIPVTVVSSSSPVIEVELKPENNSVTIAGSTRSIKNKLIAADFGYLYPSSVISMAFGLDISSDGNQRTIIIGDKTVRLWLGSDVSVIGHRPFKLTSPVIEASNGDVYLPGELLTELGILISIDEDSKVHKLTWDIVELKISISTVEEMESYKIESNKETECTIEVDEDWLICYPNTLYTEDSDIIRVWVDESKIEPDTQYKASIIVSSGLVEAKLPVEHFVKSNKKIIEVQIDSKDAKVNGEDFKLENPPFIHIDTTMVPFRFIGEAFGADIKWEADTRTVIAILGKTLIEIQIDNLEGKINGVKTKLVRAPMIVEGRTFVPFRFIGEAFGADVEWIPETKGVKVTLDEDGKTQKPELDKAEISLEWIDAEDGGLAPWEEVGLDDSGNGNLVINSFEVIGDNIEVTKADSDSIKITSVFSEDGYFGKNYVLIATNNGKLICTVDVNIYPKGTIFFDSSETRTWYINGQIQTDKVINVDGLVSTNSDKIISAVGGSYGFDSIAKELSMYVDGNNLRLNVGNGDFWLNDELMNWKFDFKVMNETDVYIPWTVYSLAFGWQISESSGGTAVSMIGKREKDPFLVTDKKSFDLIYSEAVFSYKMDDFTCPIYPMKSGNIYNSADDENFKLYCFFDTSDESSTLIPYIESINDRYSNKGLKTYLVSAEIPTDTYVESFFSGNRIIKENLAKMSLTKVTTPIIFDTVGQVCSAFPGSEFPRVYIADRNNKLVFWLPQYSSDQMLYLEQAIIKIIDGSGFVPPDIDSINISNLGGKAGSGRVTSSSSAITVLNGAFDISPAKVALSFNPDEINWNKSYESFEITLLGNSNSVHLPVRCWNIGLDQTFATFHDGLDEIKIDGLVKPLPEICESGDDPYGPIGLILESIGSNVIYPSSNSVRIISGENDVTFDLGSKFVNDAGRKIEFSKTFEMIGGFLYGPIKFLAEFTDSTVSQFEDATIVI